MYALPYNNHIKYLHKTSIFYRRFRGNICESFFKHAGKLGRSLKMCRYKVQHFNLIIVCLKQEKHYLINFTNSDLLQTR